MRFSRSLHKWVGLVLSIVFLSLAITGIMLNHKKALGYMPEVTHKASGDISQSLPMKDIVQIAFKAVNSSEIIAAPAMTGFNSPRAATGIPTVL